MDFYGILYRVGFDWQVALANTVNFLIIFFLLKKFAFKPLGELIKRRQDKITEGIAKAEEAGLRLQEVDVIAKNRLKKTDQQSMLMIQEAQERAKKLEEDLVKKAEEKQRDLLEQAKINHGRAQEEAKRNALKEAGELVRRIMVRAVELKPEAVDEALIGKAVEAIKHEV